MSIVIIATILSPSFFTPTSTAANPPQAPKLTAKSSAKLTDGVTKTVLANGLTVLTKESRTAPVVNVQVWYKVGSRNEKPGITGISHQLEHLMFKGTKDRPIQFGRLFSALGSSSNAFTSYDMTAYFGTVGSEKLEALLTLESDRMVNTLASNEALTSERKVVLSELDGGNNNPSTRLYRAVMKQAFPDSSYGWPVVGYRRDVESFTVEQVQDYYKTYYRPDNATLVVAGDFDTKAVLKQINDTFGKIEVKPAANPTASPKNSAPSKLVAQNSPQPRQPIILKEPGSVPFLQSVYPTLPPITHPDIASIDLLDTVLTAGKSGRLYQALVQTGLVSSVGGNASTMIAPGWYMFSASPAQGKSLAEIDKLILAEVSKLQDKGITSQELERAKRQIQAGYILGNRDIKSQASQLAYTQTVAGDYRFGDRYLAAIEKVTVADVQRVAKQYLNPDRRVVGYFEPTSIDPKAGTQTANSSIEHSFISGKPVDPSEVANFLPKSAFQPAPKLNPVKAEKFVMANGLTVLLLPDKSSPTISLEGEVKAGTGFDSEANAGLATFTANGLRNGTKTKDTLTLARSIEDLGASLGFSASREGVSIGASALSADLPVVIDQLADVLQNATFPAEELELSRKRSLIGLKSELDDPGSLARREFQQQLFPKGHPYHAMRTAASLKALTREDLVRFYQTHYRPDTTTLILLGDFEPKAVKDLLKQKFGNWQAAGKPPEMQYPPVEQPKAVDRKQLLLSGKTQAVTLIGHPGILRRDPRYYAALLLNQVLGGDTLASRLGTELRDRQGLTYGVYSYFQAGRNAGQFVVQMQTSAKDTEKAIAETLTLLRQARDTGLTQSELTAAKNSLLNSFPVQLADPDSIAGAILSDQVNGFEMGDFYKFPQKIKAVTLDDVNRAAKELLHPDNLLIVTATPEPKKS